MGTQAPKPTDVPVMGHSASTERLDALRAALRSRQLDGFVVPHADEHLGEYVPACAQRLAWLTGFNGSAGVAIVLLDRAAIFVDGRYTLQARAQVDPSSYEQLHLTDDPHTDWAASALTAGARLGFDPRLHPIAWVERMRGALARVRAELVALEDNPIDGIWSDRPPPPDAIIVPHPLVFAGEAADAKRARIARALTDDGLGAAVLSNPESVAWLFNIRGGDVPYTPLPLARAILTADGRASLFVDRRKVTDALRAHLGSEVEIADPAAFGSALDGLGKLQAKVRVDSGSANAWIIDRLHRAGVAIDRGDDPCALPRACKNEVELAGARSAQRRDGAAMVRFLLALDTALQEMPVDELWAVARLRAERAADPLFVEPSFETIAGTGPNGAIVHYRVTPDTNRRLEPGTLFLFDSGGQYRDGTTDVTRTIAIGTPTPRMRRDFTLVLKGHIAIAALRFPDGTTGSQIDALARQFLWQDGLDYDHGTGHGVGSFLGVHEGPQRISKVPNSVPLRPGMILSDEPGCYRANAYGIRIEALLVVTRVSEPDHPGRPMLGFEMLTVVPIDRTLIDTSLLTASERAWIDWYHAHVRETLAPLVADDARASSWLDNACAPLVE